MPNLWLNGMHRKENARGDKQHDKSFNTVEKVNQVMIICWFPIQAHQHLYTSIHLFHKLFLFLPKPNSLYLKTISSTIAIKFDKFGLELNSTLLISRQKTDYCLESYLELKFEEVVRVKNSQLKF
jgi:hypothetical protein